MIIEILASIIGFFALISIDHFFMAIGFFSIWAFLVIYLYEKLKKPVIWIFLILVGIALGTTAGVGIGTYILSAGISLLFVFLIKKFIPDDSFFGKYSPYLVAFFLFYMFRYIFGDLSNNGTFPNIQWEDIRSFLVNSTVSTAVVVLIDKFYSQLRHNGNSSNRGMGIEIRRR